MIKFIRTTLIFILAFPLGALLLVVGVCTWLGAKLVFIMEELDSGE
jgi:hypothetical protein